MIKRAVLLVVLRAGTSGAAELAHRQHAAAARSADAVRRRHAGPAGRYARRREGAGVRHRAASRRPVSRRSASRMTRRSRLPRRARGRAAERHGVNVDRPHRRHAHAARATSSCQRALRSHRRRATAQVFNGADDNASGTAALFAVAKVLQHAPAGALAAVRRVRRRGERAARIAGVRQAAAGRRRDDRRSTSTWT